MPLKCSRTDSKVQHRFQMVSQNRDRAKALYKLRERSSTSLRWKGLPALNAVFEAISQFTDPNVDEVGAEAARKIDGTRKMRLLRGAAQAAGAMAAMGD